MTIKYSLLLSLMMGSTLSAQQAFAETYNSLQDAVAAQASDYEFKADETVSGTFGTLAEE